MNNSDNEIEVLDFDENVNSTIEQTETNTNSPKQELNHKIDKPSYISYERRLIRKIVPTIIFVGISLLSLYKIYDYIANNKETFQENSNSNYSVCFDQNEYYDQQCQEENMQYLAAVTDNIKYNIAYTSLYNYKIAKEFKYYVKAELNVYSEENDNNILLHKEKKLSKVKKEKLTGEVFQITDSVNIPFKKYYQLVQDYGNKYGILTKSNFKISLLLNGKEVSSISMEIGKPTFSIKKDDIKNSKVEDKTLKEQLTLELIVYIITFMISIVLSIIFIINVILFLIKYRPKRNIYKEELKNILRNYDKIIVEIKDITNLISNKKTIEVKSFIELVDLRDTLNKPIMHIKINDIKDEFYVIDQNKVYIYVMKESKITKKSSILY